VKAKKKYQDGHLIFITQRLRLQELLIWIEANRCFVWKSGCGRKIDNWSWNPKRIN